MADWSTDNAAHVQTWFGLTVLDQHRVIFADARDLRVDQMTFWNRTASADARRLLADGLAVHLDNIYRKISRAEYQEGVDREEAVSRLRARLSVPQTMMHELGHEADTAYSFPGEVTDV